MIDQSFIHRYKTEFYSPTSKSIKQLTEQQKQLLQLLQDLHSRTQKYFQRACDKAVLKNSQSAKKNNKITLVHSTSTSSHQANLTNQENGQVCKLPAIVAEAQLKNCMSYRRVLENQVAKLEKRVQQVEREKEIGVQIRQEREKLAQLIRNNRNQHRNIKKLGDQLSQSGQKKSLKQIYEQLALEVEKKRSQNEKKQQKLYENQQKLGQLEQKNQQFQLQHPKGEKPAPQGPTQSQSSEDREIRHKQLYQNSQKLRQKILNIKSRLSQEYYFKLKQLDVLNDKNQEIQARIQAIGGQVGKLEDLVRSGVIG